MTAHIDTLLKVGSYKSKAGLRWKLAETHPVLTFLLITFGWSWLFLLAMVPFKDQDPLLVMAVSLIGGYGPAIGAILTLGLRSGLTLDLPRKRLALMAGTAAAIFSMMALEYWAGKNLGYGMVPQDAMLTLPVALATLVASLTGGWVVSSAWSSLQDIRERMASLLPSRVTARWIAFAFLFFPIMVLLSWVICMLLGMEIEYPSLWGKSALEVIPLFVLTFSLTALARGGMEEPGWRGFMQPALQKRFSPLVAALIVSVFWSLWHLPFFLNGFYSEPLVAGMIAGGIYRIFLAIFLAWAWNRSQSVLCMVILHTTFNLTMNFIPSSDLAIIGLWLVAVVIVVIKDKMYRR